MEIAIADIEKTSMWYIVGTEIFLSYEAPGPITVDIGKLTPDQVNIIRAATHAKVILTKGLDELAQAPAINKPLGKSYSTISPDVYKASEELKNLPITTGIKNAPIASVLGTDVLMLKDKRKKEIKSLLGKPIYTAKKNLIGLSVSDLKLAFEAETEGKGRASVLTVINDMISKFNSEVSDHIAKNTNHQIPKERPLSPQLTDIIDEESDPVTVDIGDIAKLINA